jgi:hypothetical protein
MKQRGHFLCQVQSDTSYAFSVISYLDLPSIVQAEFENVNKRFSAVLNGRGSPGALPMLVLLMPKTYSNDYYSFEHHNGLPFNQESKS